MGISWDMIGVCPDVEQKPHHMAVLVGNMVSFYSASLLLDCPADDSLFDDWSSMGFIGSHTVPLFSNPNMSVFFTAHVIDSLSCLLTIYGIVCI